MTNNQKQIQICNRILNEIRQITRLGIDPDEGSYVVFKEEEPWIDSNELIEKWRNELKRFDKESEKK